jgi:hypothetical protein
MMKIWALSLAAALTIGAGAFGVGQALATATHQATPKTLKIVMHDPGCHWFRVAGKLTTKAASTGRVRLVNFDEDAVKVMSRHGMRRVAVGKSLVVGRGHYVITMVKQASDDNYLKLTVR